MDRTGGISIVDREEEVVTTEDEIFKGDGVGKAESWRDGVCMGDQRSVGSEMRERVVHLGVAMLEGRVSGEEAQEDKVAVVVSEGELMMFGEWLCRWDCKWKWE